MKLQNKTQKTKETDMTNPIPSHAVRARRYFYGPTETVDIVFLGNLADCKSYVSSQDNRPYYLAHNESGRSALKIVKTRNLSRSAMMQAQSL
jgi:hypothetical protein